LHINHDNEKGKGSLIDYYYNYGSPEKGPSLRTTAVENTRVQTDANPSIDTQMGLTPIIK